MGFGSYSHIVVSLTNLKKIRFRSPCEKNHKKKIFSKFWTKTFCTKIGNIGQKFLSQNCPEIFFYHATSKFCFSKTQCEKSVKIRLIDSFSGKSRNANWDSESDVFNSGQRMALRAVYVVIC